MPSLNFKRRNGFASILVIIVLIALSAIFTISSLTSIEWPFASGSPFALNPFGPQDQPSGIVELNASSLVAGSLAPVSGGIITFFKLPGGHQAGKNTTNSFGLTRYELSEGRYFVEFSSSYGSASDTITISAGNVTEMNYLLINESVSALSFDILSQEPNIVAPWDELYVEIPDSFPGLNLSQVQTYIQPLYIAPNASLSHGPKAPRGFPTTHSSPDISASILSEEIQPSDSTLWLQLKPQSMFSSSALENMTVLEYNSSLTVVSERRA